MIHYQPPFTVAINGQIIEIVMTRAIKILLQTTIPTREDDWHIGRFSLLRDHLASISDENGTPLCKVTTRDRETNVSGDDPELSHLDATDFDELWLIAVDNGDRSKPANASAFQFNCGL